MGSFESTSQLQRAFDTLGISRHATLPEVRRAYRLLVRRWHPDRFANEPLEQHRALEMLKGINEAFERILAERAQGKNDNPDRSRNYATPTAASPQPSESGRESRKPEPAASLSSVQIDTVFFASFVSKKNLLCVAVVIAFIAAGIVTVDYIAYRNELKGAILYESDHPSDAGEGGSLYGTLPSGGVPGEGLSGRPSKVPSGPVPPSTPYVQSPYAPLVPEAPVAPAAPVAAPAR